MPLAYLSLGSNLGDRDGHLEEARQVIRNTFLPVRFSRLYETEPVDLKDQPWFLNQVAEVFTDLAPGTLLEWARLLEKGMGRQRDVPKGPRTLDVDILLYDDQVHFSEDLLLPHPRLHLRRHVLVPLAELAPDKALPGLGLTVLEALGKVEDKAEVRVYPKV
jgi:2-amino-4-hydroxy-6-hydroxymethyldihydropteridine diphosphokinase